MTTDLPLAGTVAYVTNAARAEPPGDALALAQRGGNAVLPPMGYAIRPHQNAPYPPQWEVVAARRVVRCHFRLSPEDAMQSVLLRRHASSGAA